MYLGRDLKSTFEIGAVMLNREFSVKLKLPPATVNDFDLTIYHCDQSWEGVKKI